MEWISLNYFREGDRVLLDVVDTWNFSIERNSIDSAEEKIVARLRAFSKTADFHTPNKAILRLMEPI